MFHGPLWTGLCPCVYTLHLVPAKSHEFSHTSAGPGAQGPPEVWAGEEREEKREREGGREGWMDGWMEGWMEGERGGGREVWTGTGIDGHGIGELHGMWTGKEV